MTQHQMPVADRPSDAVLAKVRKILAKAEDAAATTQEAETYTAKAAELIAAYGIDRALLAESLPGSDVVGDRVVVLEAPYALDKANLLSGVAIALRCQAVQRTRYDGGAKELSMHLFGYESDLARAEVLYTSLLLQATALMRRSYAPLGEPRSLPPVLVGGFHQRCRAPTARVGGPGGARCRGC